MSVKDRYDRVYEDSSRKIRSQEKDSLEFWACTAAYKSMDKADQDMIYDCWQNMRKKTGQNFQAGVAYHILSRLGVWFAENGL